MQPTTILNYWFGETIQDAENTASDKQPLWFTGSKDIDSEITEKFGSALEDAKNGKFNDWENTPQNRLALIILLDQFSRNIYRNTPRMYESDPQSLQLCLAGIEQKVDDELFPIHRQFFYMPLQHAEDLQLQEKSVQMYTKTWEEAPESTKEYFAQTVTYAKKHHDVIAMFGRFPHRNAILQRESTKEEKEFLQTPGSSF
ncbi:DUF924 family protein [Candidatus Uabimicrobium amorphum]|uniref:DUF924 domain-containing protein n=1 Tax=Uabimicrobium amorphum TaxID=2596890 RepID=A0A5S9INP0_UABAM|nr:DUF924 family protein [Candidatus Uabimicrobium amorphum]BBM84867.1 hypothetical protein UABAM_03228 [Candidatus Uabimicrobium amorphum]